ncbi:MAG TPA: TIM barrel protein, partial [Spirochaetia bacterium]
MKLGIMTALFADRPLPKVVEHVSRLGYEAVELPAWANNGHTVLEDLVTPAGARKLKTLLADHGLVLSALNEGIAGQLSMGPYDASTDPWLKGTPEEKAKYAADRLVKVAQAASELEVPVVTGLIGSHVWDKWYIFPPA